MKEPDVIRCIGYAGPATEGVHLPPGDYRVVESLPETHGFTTQEVTIKVALEALEVERAEVLSWQQPEAEEKPEPKRASRNKGKAEEPEAE